MATTENLADQAAATLKAISTLGERLASVNDFGEPTGVRREYAELAADASSQLRMLQQRARSLKRRLEAASPREGGGGYPEHQFVVKFQVPAMGGMSPAAQALDDMIEELGGAGCSYALVGIGSPGKLVLSVSRGAASFEAAVQAVVDDVRFAIPLAELLEVVPGA